MDFHVDLQVEVVVSEVFTPTNFYIQLKKDQDKLGSMMEAMESFYTDNPDLKKMVIPAELVRVGQLVAVVWDVDGFWYRGLVRRVMSVSKVEVDFMDYGSRTVMDKKSLYDLLPKFCELDRQAHQAKLHGIAPLQKKWVRRNSTRFKDLVRASGEEEGVVEGFLGKVVGIGGKKLKLKLVDIQSEGRNIGDVLVHEGHARYAGEDTDTQIDAQATSQLLSPPVLDSLRSCLAEVEGPLPPYLIEEVNSLKREAIILRQKIEVSNGEGLEDMAKEQKDLTNRSIGQFPGIVFDPQQK